MAASGKVWDLSKFFAPVANDGAKVRYALILLNTPIPHDHWHAFVQLWRHADLRICADGAANRLLDSVGSDAWDEMPLPSMICGDLDSVRDDVRGFFEDKGVKVLHWSSEYSTDLQKCVQVLEDIEQTGTDEYELVIFGGLGGRLDQSLHTLHVLWQLAPNVPMGEIIAEPGEPGKPPPPGEPSFMGGFFSTSNHLAPDNPEGMVHIGTDAPVYWTVELQRDP
ncbi:ribonuclease Z [Malassezia brasiliensis]|uniref:Ribonuclease Z n=1 Tax=Malassezia brasiliensis TaxID=1821822 RepID=A0AAF0IP30_9BASI|nr:ribonuclease Z [Malassezia brasiliensis]